MSEEAAAEAVLAFWYGPACDADPAALVARQALWFGSDSAFDMQIRASYSDLLAQAAAGELRRWKLSPRGTLALILLFDQFPRNMFRHLPQAFAYDARAQALCRDGLALGIDDSLSVSERLFYYMPLEHAEDRAAQALSLRCFERLHAQAPTALHAVTGNALAHAREHHDIIERFGRFPHRNLVLDRVSTTDELAWIAAHRGAYGQA